MNPNPTRQAIDIAIKLALIFLIVAWCLQIVMPFITFIVWGAVIAISCYGPFRKMRDKLGNKPAVTLFTVVGLAFVIVPAWLFAGSLVESVQSFNTAVEQGSFDIDPPNDKVKDWPVVGEKLFAAWSEASENFDSFLEDYNEQLNDVARFLGNTVKSIGLTVLLFILAVLIAAAMLARDESSVAAMRRLSTRLVEERGEEMLNLATATIRSVTVGVLGIAFIQAVGTGLGMIIVGVPGAALWALLVLILVIAQLPALLVMGPVIVYVFSVESTTVAIIFAIWSVLVSMSDVVLKPLLLGRGVDAPMLVILLGAIGGMMMSGIIGLFVGAVVLALGYKLYQSWLVQGHAASIEASQPGQE